MSHWTQNTSFRRHSSQPISWCRTKETKSNTTKANNTTTKQSELNQKNTKNASPDGVAPSWLVSVSASVNLPLHHKVQKFSSGTGSPGWSQKRAVKWLCVCVCVIQLILQTIIIAEIMSIGGEGKWQRFLTDQTPFWSPTQH